MTHLYHGTCQNKHSDNLPLTGQNCKDVLSLSHWKASLNHSHIFTLDLVSLAISIKSSFLPALEKLSITNNFSTESSMTEKRKTPDSPEHSTSHPVQSGRRVRLHSDRSTAHGKCTFPRDPSPTDSHLGKFSQSELHFLEQISWYRLNPNSNNSKALGVKLKNASSTTSKKFLLVRWASCDTPL